MLAQASLALAPAEVAERLDAIRAAHGSVLIVDEWGAPSGLVALHRYPTLHAARPVGLITMLVVASTERRRGLGRALLKAAAQAARVAGCEDLEVTVRTDQAHLRAFCLATGFVGAGDRLLRPLRKRS